VPTPSQLQIACKSSISIQCRRRSLLCLLLSLETRRSLRLTHVFLQNILRFTIRVFALAANWTLNVSFL
jgi:hypothetical protein